MAAMTWPANPTPPHSVYRWTNPDTDFHDLVLADNLQWATTIYITAPSDADVHYVPAGGTDANYCKIAAGTSACYNLANQSPGAGPGSKGLNGGGTLKVKCTTTTKVVQIELMATGSA